jgi:Domain of unknown function (DUF4340)
MNSRTLTNIILLFVLLAFIGFYINSKNKAPDIQRLTTLSLDEINNIQIPRDGKTDIVLQKQTDLNGKAIWHMVKPYAIKAHQFRANTLLGLSQLPIDESFDSRTLNLQHYALDKPRARIVFNKTEISFGKTNPLNNQRYLKTDNKLVLVSDETYPLVSAQPATFVDLMLLPEKNISALALADLQIEKMQGAHWKSSSKALSANALTADQIQTVLQNWRGAQAFAVHRYMPRKKLGMIKITFEDTVIDFELSDDDPWLILARPDLGIEYHLDSSQKENLFGPFNSITNPAHTAPSQSETSGAGNA